MKEIKEEGKTLLSMSFRLSAGNKREFEARAGDDDFEKSQKKKRREFGAAFKIFSGRSSSTRLLESKVNLRRRRERGKKRSNRRRKRRGRHHCSSLLMRRSLLSSPSGVTPMADSPTRSRTLFSECDNCSGSSSDRTFLALGQHQAKAKKRENQMKKKIINASLRALIFILMNPPVSCFSSIFLSPLFRSLSLSLFRTGENLVLAVNRERKRRDRIFIFFFSFLLLSIG